MLPGDAYTKGFLRTYAEFLGLDGQLYIDEFNARIAQREEEPLVPEVMKKQGRAGGILFRTTGAVILVGAAIAGLAAWRHAGTPARPTIDSAAAAPQPRVHHLAPAAKKSTPAVASTPTFTVIRAVRDRSWLSVRIGGPSGKEIFRGTLEQGHFLKFGLQHGIWLRMGRPLALDIRVGSRLVHNLPASPTNLVLGVDSLTR